jgi:phosphoribosylformylglycinamidine synthase subunit PurQ / glutaminase
MKYGVVVFPGSNCDHDLLYVLGKVLNLEVVSLWHKDTSLHACDFIFLPGGFSYGDYLRSGAIARFSPVMKSLTAFANDGGYVMGICNGFQILCESGLLPGALLHNSDQKFICRNTNITAQTTNTIVTAACTPGSAMKIPIAHGEGRYYADKKTLAALNNNQQVLFRYCDENGKITTASNPNGSVENIAGICNATRNVFGMMPHPERASDPELFNTDGMGIFGSMIRELIKTEVGA